MTVTGPPRWIWRRKVGTTLPRLPEHVAEPHRDEVAVVRLGDLLHDLLGDPLRGAHELVGRTALSVEMSTRCSTPNSAASSATFRVPRTLLVTASAMFASISGTCLCAAAWNTA